MKAGCLVGVDEDAEDIVMFDTEEEARAELAKHPHKVQNLNNGDLFRVTDYVIRVGEYDEDGEYIGTSVEYIVADWVIE